MPQTILNFNIETTNEKLTPRTGVAILGEYLKGMNLEALCNTNLPLAKHPNGYTPFEFIYPLILMLHSGGRVLDDIKEIRLDTALGALLKMDNIPTASAFTKYLHKHNSIGENGIRKINNQFLKRFLKSIKSEELILDIDATFIEAHKNTAKWSYKDAPGYMPMVGHINGGYVIDVDFRDGNEAPASKNLEFLKQCQAQLPLSVKFDRFRADSASYQAAIFNHCDKENILFSVTAKKNKNVFDSIKDIKDKEWQQFSKKEKVAEFMHTMQDTDNAFRMIVIKKDITPVLPTLEEYISDEVMMQHQDEIYYCIATNDNDLSPQEIIKLHRQRGETSENKIKELKNGFNMSYLPTSNTQANAFYFAIGTLAYNLFLLFKQILDANLQKHTVKTIRYKLYNIAGKVVSHAREVTLKVNEQFQKQLQKIRYRAYEESLQ
ncbi:IS1380 family transposase [Sulfurimonas sp.]|uniref:IS1380 family transposase n=1 Tax=Sulfurimonas sp. TaxID=2022749 RepID=UPI0019F2B582|nr:IS1380 family transposase [Sulfurimonas sp.]MBE0515751.1 IS1380 family transposase [Sulfurimonas sp.]